MKTVLIPKAGLIVRDPVTRDALPAEGLAVAVSPYWLRRLREGDVTCAAPVTPAAGVENPWHALLSHPRPAPVAPVVAPAEAAAPAAPAPVTPAVVPAAAPTAAKKA